MVYPLRRQRLGHTHKNTLALVRHYDAIVHEDLQIANVAGRPEPRPDDSAGYAPNGALQGTRNVT